MRKTHDRDTLLCLSCAGVVDGPPHEWSAAVRQSLANTILTEYHNSGDGWENAMSNLDALLDLRPKPDASGTTRNEPTDQTSLAVAATV
jgi:hypothetical protein